MSTSDCVGDSPILVTKIHEIGKTGLKDTINKPYTHIFNVYELQGIFELEMIYFGLL